MYFMAIIDILTHYDAKKKAAHAAKTVKHGVSTGSLTQRLAPPPSRMDTSSPFWLTILSPLATVPGSGVSTQPCSTRVHGSGHL